MNLYFDHKGIKDTEAETQARKICSGIKDEGLKKLNASGLSEADKKNPDKLWEFFKAVLK